MVGLPDVEARKIRESFGKVAVLLGGAFAERDTSLASGQAVLPPSPSATEHQRTPLRSSASVGLRAQHTQRFDRAFIALHGGAGEDGTIRGVLEWLGIHYSGSDVAASALAAN